MLPEPRFLVDAGPLVAYFSPRDVYHKWARQTLDPIVPPLATCEPVLAEAFHMLAKYEDGTHLLIEYCQPGILRVDFQLMNHLREIDELVQKYRDLPMDLADACLVLLAEQHPQATVITTDRDFLTYRTRNRRHIRLLAPFVP